MDLLENDYFSVVPVVHLNQQTMKCVFFPFSCKRPCKVNSIRTLTKDVKGHEAEQEDDDGPLVAGPLLERGLHAVPKVAEDALLLLLFERRFGLAFVDGHRPPLRRPRLQHEAHGVEQRQQHQTHRGAENGQVAAVAVQVNAEEEAHGERHGEARVQERDPRRPRLAGADIRYVAARGITRLH